MHKLFRFLLLPCVLVSSIVFTPALIVQAQGLSFPAEINKSFSPISITAGEISRLNVTIFNPNSFQLDNAAWADNLIGVQPGIFLANPVNLSNTCGGAVIAVAGATSLSLTGGNVPAQVGTTPGSCTVAVDVTSTTPGNLINTIPIGGLTSTGGGGSITNTTPASATLRVGAVQAPSLSKSFTPNTMWVGQTSQLAIVIRNNDLNTILTQTSLTDNLPPNVILANPVASTLIGCGGSASLTAVSGTRVVTLNNSTIAVDSTCTINVNVTSVTAGVYDNTIPAGAIATRQGVTNDSPASSSLNVQAVGIVKASSPRNFQAGGVSTLTITLQNPTGTAYTGVNLTDILPVEPNANLTVVLGSAATTCGSGVVSTTAPRTVTLTGGTIPAGTAATPGTCTITFLVTTPTGDYYATYTNIIPAGAMTTTQGVTNVIPATTTVSVYPTGAGIGGSKSFTPATINAGDNSLLIIYIGAPQDTSLTNFSITDNLPTGVTVSNWAAPAIIGCGATPPLVLTATTGATSISLTGGTILAGAGCQISVWVTSSTPGTVTNTITRANITNTENRSLDADFVADLTVQALSDFSISKIFTPSTVNPNGISTLTITLQNTNSSGLVNVSLLDTLPGSTTDGVVIASIPNASTTCGSGVVAVTSGAQTISMTGGVIAAQQPGPPVVPGICTINVDVQGVGSPATRTNTIPIANVSGTIQGTGTTINPVASATAPLTIANLSIGVVKGFNPLTVFSGSASTMSVELVNPNNAPLTGIAFSDNMPVGMIIANPPNFSVGTCGGTLTGVSGAGLFSFSGGNLPANTSCTVTISVTMTVNGNLTNTIAAGAVTTLNGASNPQPAAASLTNLPGAVVSKAFAPNPIAAGLGNFSLLTITIENIGNISLSGMGLNDALPGTLPAGLQIAGGLAPPPNNTCGGTLVAVPGTQSIQLANGTLAGGSSCTIVVSVTGTTPGDYQNIIPIGALTSAQGATNNQPATATLTLTGGTTASIGNFVWNDLNANGIQDAGETGIPNVTVNLLNAAGTVLTTTTTNASGLYGFTNLTPGTYGVEFVPPAGFSFSPQDQGGNDGLDSDVSPTTGRTVTTTLVGGENDLSWDAGLNQLASLGDYVWNDVDADGIQDGTESGIDGVTVRLRTGAGALVATTTTASGGLYLFSGLTPGDYYVEFVPPAGFNISPQDQGGNDGLDSDVSPTTGRTVITTLVGGENDLSWDAGLNQSAALGNFVWNDLNANGIQDAGETGIANVTVNLLNAVGTVLATTTTDINGLYSFTNLAPGTYRVDFVPPAGYTISSANQGANDAVDSDADTTSGETANVTLVAGETNNTLDAGLHQLAALGNFVWNDLNANGIQDGTENGIDGVTVNLYTGTGTFVMTTTTAGGGVYLFSGLTPGDYYVEFVPPAGYTRSPANQGADDALDSDANTITGETGIYTLVAGETNNTVDAGVYSQQGLTKIVSDTNQTFTTGISNVAIGEIITYQVSLLVPPGTFMNANLVDTMQRGLAFVGCDTISGGAEITTSLSGGFSAACSAPTVDDAGGGGTPIGVDVDRRVTFDLGNVTNSGTLGAILTFTYRAVVLDIGSNVDGIPPVTLSNSASFLWGNGSSLDPVAAIVSIVEPELTIDKSVNNNFISIGTEVTFTLVGTHAANSHTDAFDVVVTDTLPAEFDFVSGSLTCNTGAQVTANCSYNPATRTITAVWPTFTRLGGDLRVQFKVIGNNLLVPGVSVTNVGSIEWTSLPGPVNLPQSYSPNNYSTERYYDPLDATGVNSYGANDSLVLNGLGGGGGGNGEERGERNDGNARGIAQAVGGFLIPVTGFAPGIVTDLSGLPVARYDANLDLSLEIPRLKLNMPIVGAPLKNGGWDVKWLTNQAGWLEKTAFPGFLGNSVLTGHVISSYGVAGPFASLHKLQEGDLIFIHTFGQTQIYKVRTVKKVQPNDISVLDHLEKPWLTLLTCADYNEKTNKYLSRVVVRADLIEVHNGNINGQ